MVAQDFTSRSVLMLAYANADAVRQTLKTGVAHYWSRSRGRLWRKGETSGNVQRVWRVVVDCDRDALLYLVDQRGNACHTGASTCFHQGLSGSALADQAAISQLVERFEAARVVRRAWKGRGRRRQYTFYANAVTEAIPPLPAELTAWIAEQLDALTPSDVDKVVVPEALGLPYAVLVAQRKRRPLAIIRKQNYHVPEACLGKVPYASGYERGTYYIYGVTPKDRILLIDDTISTGGTLASLLRTFQAKKVQVAGAGCVLDKPAYGGRRRIEQDFGIDVRVLFHSRMHDGTVHCEPGRDLSLLLRSQR